MIEIDHIYNMDCMQGMASMPDESIDAIITDLPYGTSASSWDKALPMAPLWEQYLRLIKPRGAIVLFAQQPFTTLLIASNLKYWKYNWVWKKDNATNFLNSHFQPMKITEDICVFSKAPSSFTKNGEPMAYYPQMEEGTPYTCKTGRRDKDVAVTRGNVHAVEGYETVNSGTRMPTNILTFKRDKDTRWKHPTQKPLALLRYLVRTYSQTGQTVLDSCIGSGTTIEACIRESRHYIGFETNEAYFQMALLREQEARNNPYFFSY